MSKVRFDIDVAHLFQMLNSKQPVREAFHKYGGHYRCVVRTNKGLDGEIPCESGLARDAVRVFNLAHKVVLVVPEPFTLTFIFQGEIYNYTPDYLLYLRDDSRAVVEVKYQEEADLPYNTRRFAALQQLFTLANAQFAVLTEKTVRAPILSRNVALVESQLARTLPAKTVEVMLNLLRSGPATFGQLTEAVGNRYVVLAAIGQGILEANLTKPLLDSTIIRRA